MFPRAPLSGEGDGLLPLEILVNSLVSSKSTLSDVLAFLAPQSGGHRGFRSWKPSMIVVTGHPMKVAGSEVRRKAGARLLATEDVESCATSGKRPRKPWRTLNPS